MRDRKDKSKNGWLHREVDRFRFGSSLTRLCVKMNWYRITTTFNSAHKPLSQLVQVSVQHDTSIWILGPRSKIWVVILPEVIFASVEMTDSMSYYIFTVSTTVDESFETFTMVSFPVFCHLRNSWDGRSIYCCTIWHKNIEIICPRTFYYNAIFPWFFFLTTVLIHFYHTITSRKRWGKYPLKRLSYIHQICSFDEFLGFYVSTDHFQQTQYNKMNFWIFLFHHQIDEIMFFYNYH